ncbi:MAG: hypothetical protein DRP01_02300 [Archaeoglobales archaeon]|nr:MAG: hypothetical protein DRP01_02300 [Archaeoglobales archaeon]
MPKKLLVVTPVYWPEGGGGMLATHLIIESLSKLKNVEITVLTSTSDPIKVKGVRYIADPLLRKIEKSFPLTTLVEKRYKKLIQEHDIVYLAYAFTFIPVAKRLKKKVIVHLHDYKIISPSSVIPYTCSVDPSLIKLIKESFRIKHLECKSVKSTILNLGDSLRTFPLLQWVQMASTVIATSKRHAELITRVVPSIKDKLRVIYNPPPPIPNIEKKPNQIPIFLYVGGDSYIKGFPILLEAIVKFLKEGRKAKFIFAGKYSRKSLAYVSTINRLYGSGIIQVVGRLPHDELMRLHKIAWALIFPSICEEPLPYAVLEAIVSNTIPLPSRIGGVIEILNGTRVEEYMFKPGDVDDMLERVYLLQELSPKNVIEIGEEVRESVLKKLMRVNLSEAWRSVIYT